MVVVLVMNGSQVQTFRVGSMEEMEEDMKNIKNHEERIYEVGSKENSYYVNGKGLRMKLKYNPGNGMGPFDDILPP